MPGRINLYLLLGLFFVITEGSYAMNKTGCIERDTTEQATIRFEYRLSEVDSTYAGNRNTIQWLDSQFANPPIPDKRFTVDEARRIVEQEYTVATEMRQTKRTTVLALKNNLLYDLALAPNLEIEVPIGKHWSLNTECKCPWWLNNSRDFCYQLLSGGIEGRYWLGNREHRSQITGHFIGLYAEGGVYDFQFGGDGYQGKYYGASGLTYGYVKQIARNLALEFSLGVGYLTTEYRKYAPYKDDLIWTNSGRYNFIGPTKAKVSLVWLITTRR